MKKVLFSNIDPFNSFRFILNLNLERDFKKNFNWEFFYFIKWRFITVFPRLLASFCTTGQLDSVKGKSVVSIYFTKYYNIL